MTMSADISLHHRSVFGTTMAYRELGRSDAPHVLFLHGNPTSSYIWRNIMPLVAPVGHCIAPDLIGYGQSGTPDSGHSFDFTGGQGFMAPHIDLPPRPPVTTDPFTGLPHLFTGQTGSNGGAGPTGDGAGGPGFGTAVIDNHGQFHIGQGHADLLV